MLLYKFKSAQDALYALDIAIHERIFCAPYAMLNDPFEGQFRTLIGDRSLGFPSIFTHGFGRQNSRVAYTDLGSMPLSGPSRVGSLSADWRDVRMWALYADSFRGLAFEFEVEPDEPELHQVLYGRELPKLNVGLLMPSETVDALTHKTEHWSYETEWRYISEREYIDLPGRLRSIYLGSGVTAAVRDAVLKVAPSHTKVHLVGLDPVNVQMKLGPELPRSYARAID
jgi:hypothetical protein